MTFLLSSNALLLTNQPKLKLSNLINISLLIFLTACQPPDLFNDDLPNDKLENTSTSNSNDKENIANKKQKNNNLPPFTTMADDKINNSKKYKIKKLQAEILNQKLNFDQQFAILIPTKTDSIIINQLSINKNSNSTNIAILLPFKTAANTKHSRGLQRLGKSLLNSAEMALFDWRNPSINLIPLNTFGTPQGAAQAAKIAIAKGADIILGPLLATSVNAVSNIINTSNIPIISYSNREEIANDNTYIIGFMPQQQVDALILHSIENNITKFAVMAPEGSYGEKVVKALQIATEKFGGEITRIQFYDTNATDFSRDVKIISDYDKRRKILLDKIAALEARDDEISQAALHKIKQRETLGDVDFEAILLPAQNDRNLRTIATQLAYYDVDQPRIKILGLQLWDSFNNLSSEPPLIGSWYATLPIKGQKNFIKRYKNIYKTPPDRLASLANDSMALAIILAGLNGSPNYSKAALTNTTGFTGIEGIFRLKSNGIAERGFAIREIRKDGNKTIKPAPTNFN